MVPTLVGNSCVLVVMNFKQRYLFDVHRMHLALKHLTQTNHHTESLLEYSHWSAHSQLKASYEHTPGLLKLFL